MTTNRVVAVVAVGTAAVVGSGIVATETTNDSDCFTAPTPIVIELDDERHANVLDNARDAVEEGLPAVVTLDREGADDNRDESLAGIPTRAGFDRDEYPPASSTEGGAGASVRYVDSSENRSAGTLLGHQLAPYCDGQSFRYEDVTE